MPFLRFSRDKRGYEHTYLLHANAKRGGAARLLYWYRTPPGVKVGRPAFDESVREALEAQYPGIGFDWPKLMSTPLPPPDAEHWRERRRAEKAARQARQGTEREPREPSEVAAPTALEHPNDELARDEAAGQGQQATADASVLPRAVADGTGEPSFATRESEAAAGTSSPENSVATPRADLGTPQPAPMDASGRTKRRRRRGGRRRRRELPSDGAGGPGPVPDSGADDSEAAGDQDSPDGSDASD